MIDKGHGGDISRYPAKFGEPIDFSASINPLGMPPAVKEALTKALSSVVHYPEPDSRTLVASLAGFHNISPLNIAVGNGSIELIHLVPRALGARRVLIITPTFSEYEFAAASQARAEIIFADTEEENGFRLEVSAIENILEGADLVFLCNPNNPTGVCYNRREISLVLKLCARSNAVLLIDEVFMDFVKDCEDLTFVAESPGHKNLLVLRSLTKSFALPGLRIGYLTGNGALVDRIRRLQYPWNVSSLAQSASIEALKDKGYMERTREYIISQRSDLFENLRSLKGLRPYLPSANFILCKLGDCMVRDARGLKQALLKRGIAIRVCDNFRGLNNKFFRVAVRTREENKGLIAALKEVLGEWQNQSQSSGQVQASARAS